METNEIQVMESIYLKNEEKAREINEYLTGKKIFAVNVMGAPGAGKTTALINITKLLKCSCSVIEGDVESDIDMQKLTTLGIQTVQINTGGACHLDSPQIFTALEQMKLESGCLFIENIGNLICPVEFLIGEHIKMVISSVTEGSDKPYKYPLAFEKADVIIVNKCDLLNYVDFDKDFFETGIRKLNKTAPILYVSGKTGEGFNKVADWIEAKAESVIKFSNA